MTSPHITTIVMRLMTIECSLVQIIWRVALLSTVCSNLSTELWPIPSPTIRAVVRLQLVSRSILLVRHRIQASGSSAVATLLPLALHSLLMQATLHKSASVSFTSGKPSCKTVLSQQTLEGCKSTLRSTHRSPPRHVPAAFGNRWESLKLSRALEDAEVRESRLWCGWSYLMPKA